MATKRRSDEDETTTTAPEPAAPAAPAATPETQTVQGAQTPGVEFREFKGGRSIPFECGAPKPEKAEK